MTDHHDTDNQEQGGSPHTSAEEGHPAGTGERSERDVGGPTSPEGGDGEETGGAPGTKPEDEGFDSHE
jgi:hypothetical protein